VITRAEVLAALSDVRDPELDQPLTELGFVAAVDVRGAEVGVRLRLPTFYCAPNFTWIMAADARDAVAALDGVAAVRVSVDDQFTSDEIAAGLAAGKGFREAFPDHAAGDLGELRTLFARKAFLARQYAVCEPLKRAGRGDGDLAALTLADAGTSPDAEAYRRRRAELGLDMSPESPLVVTPAGRAVDAAGMSRHLGYARMTRISIDTNAEMCKGLLHRRYGISEEEALTA
jgi:metal-sulfur cluster biosynthetic enzyme